ncbi:MAG: KilA-N domain-containing protein [Kiritimatiellae bacterium]|nr:KilA-N domain-containing protein [Kiritimatiellia bacterium]
MKNTTELTIKNTTVRVTKINDEDYICLTDMLKAKDGDFFITDWLRNRNTLEFIGIWEQVYNPGFNYGEFATIRNQRDYATINQLICISNMENINAVMINDGIPQPQRLKRLNEIAIHQMRVLSDVGGRQLLK